MTTLAIRLVLLATAAVWLLASCTPAAPPVVGFSAEGAGCDVPLGCHAYPPSCRIAVCYCPYICSVPQHPIWATSAAACACG